MKRTAITGSFVVLVLAATGCAEKEKSHPPVVARFGDTVKAISLEEAETVCQQTQCEPNQIYRVNFGKKKEAPPAPVKQPVKEPITVAPDPSTLPPSMDGQPAETLDYSRTLLNMSAAWRVSEGSTEVIVAVVDTGVDYTHPDLYANIFVNSAERDGLKGVDDDGNGFIDDVSGYDFYNDRGNGFDDGGGHGTHCAGIIGAVKNGIGVRGISPRVKILPLKFLSRSGSGDTADAVAAINYAVKMGAKVISNSWGGGGASQFLAEAIANARSKGVIVVAAAGNESANNDAVANYPANYPGVIAVGSTDAKDAISPFSNYGKKNVLVLAPGGAIRSTYLGASYTVMSGTSMAAPQVSGAIALALAVNGGLTEAEVKDDLCSSSTKKLTQYSVCGRMDVGNFVETISKR